MMKLENDTFRDAASVASRALHGNDYAPSLMVSREFAHVLDGVSYVKPVIYEGHHSEIGKAVEFAASKGFSPVVLQLVGRRDEVLKESFKANNIPAGTMADSFDKEPWRMAGKFKEWYQLPPLVFDKRDGGREQDLMVENKFIAKGKKKPVILLALESSTSPFPYAALLRRLVTACFPHYRVVELPKAERIYDLLALYEKASLLIAIDSAPLHLAWACRKTPVFALTQDKPSLWHGSAWRPNHLWYCRYQDWPKRAEAMINAIEALPDYVHEPSMVRVWSEYLSETESAPTGDALAVTVGMCGRDSANSIKDTRRIPYLKDILRMAMQRVESDDAWIMVKRGDVVVDDGQIGVKPPFYAYRITKRDEGDEFRPVGDLFCATRSWWKTMMKEIPDLLLSGDFYWSQCLWGIFHQAGAKDVTGVCHRIIAPNAKIWKGTENVSAKHNSELTAAYIKTSKIRSRYPEVSDQIECLPLETDKLIPFGYNPAITKMGDNLLMIYRYHSGGHSTQLAQSFVGMDGRVHMNEKLSISGHSLEDARFFNNGKTLGVSFVDSTMPNMPIRAVVKRGSYVAGTVGEVVQDSLPRNDSSSIQKNWVYFTHEERLFCIYQCHPVHSVYEIHEHANTLYAAPAPKWAYGEVRGGTPPIPYEGKLLRFFHSRLMNELGNISHRYFVGAYLMNPEPPFAVVSVSKRPIAYGSESDSLTKEQRKACYHRKPNCVLPFGAVEHGNEFLVSIGINDAQCAIAKVKPENLNL